MFFNLLIPLVQQGGFSKLRHYKKAMLVYNAQNHLNTEFKHAQMLFVRLQLFIMHLQVLLLLQHVCC